MAWSFCPARLSYDDGAEQLREVAVVVLPLYFVGRDQGINTLKKEKRYVN